MLALTGSTGFVGSYIAPSLPYPQKRLTRNSIPSLDSSIQIMGDLNNPSVIEALVDNVKTLVHLAWSSTPWTSNRDIPLDIGQNLISTVQLFEAFAKKNPEGHIVFASTGGNMYKGQFKVASKEIDPPSPWSSYSVNKLAAENYLRLFCARYGIKATVMRISNPYGVILPSSRPNGLIGVVFAKLLNNEALNIIDSLESVRDYLHLEDLKEAFKVIIENPPDKGEFRLFNVSSGVGYSMQQILDMIEHISGKQVIKHFSNSQCIPSWSVLSPSQLHASLKWRPKIHLDEGLKQIWSNLRECFQNKPKEFKNDRL